MLTIFKEILQLILLIFRSKDRFISWYLKIRNTQVREGGEGTKWCYIILEGELIDLLQSVTKGGGAGQKRPKKALHNI